MSFLLPATIDASFGGAIAILPYCAGFIAVSDGVALLLPAMGQERDVCDKENDVFSRRYAILAVIAMVFAMLMPSGGGFALGR
jgi:hypothetical protein